MGRVWTMEGGMDNGRGIDNGKVWTVEEVCEQCESMDSGRDMDNGMGMDNERVCPKLTSESKFDICNYYSIACALNIKLGQTTISAALGPSP